MTAIRQSDLHLTLHRVAWAMARTETIPASARVLLYILAFNSRDVWSLADVAGATGLSRANAQSVWSLRQRRTSASM